MRMEDFEGRVAVITGGAAGIGKALAQELSELGATVVIADLPGVTLDDTIRELGITGVSTDVSDPGAVDALADTVMKTHGKVDLLFNNAGVGLQQSLFRIGLRDWQWVFDVNVWGVVNGLRSFMEPLRANRDGAYVVNTASLMSLYSSPGMAAYASSKWAVLAITETLAREVAVSGENIGVTAFCPGPIETTIYQSLERRDDRYGSTRPTLDPDDPVERAFLNFSNIEKMPARTAAKIALDAVREGRFWAITHPEYTAQVEPEHRELMDAIERERNVSR